VFGEFIENLELLLLHGGIRVFEAVQQERIERVEGLEVAVDLQTALEHKLFAHPDSCNPNFVRAVVCIVHVRIIGPPLVVVGPLILLVRFRFDVAESRLCLDKGSQPVCVCEHVCTVKCGHESTHQDGELSQQWSVVLRGLGLDHALEQTFKVGIEVGAFPESGLQDQSRH